MPALIPHSTQQPPLLLVSSLRCLPLSLPTPHTLSLHAPPLSSHTQSLDALTVCAQHHNGGRPSSSRSPPSRCSAVTSSTPLPSRYSPPPPSGRPDWPPPLSGSSQTAAGRGRSRSRSRNGPPPDTGGSRAEPSVRYAVHIGRSSARKRLVTAVSGSARPFGEVVVEVWKWWKSGLLRTVLPLTSPIKLARLRVMASS